MNFDMLPNDILDIIYNYKTRMEYKHVLAELINQHNFKIFNRAVDICSNMFNNHMTRYYEPENIAYILTAMRNDGHISSDDLYNQLVDIESDILSLNYDQDMLVIDIGYFMTYEDITLEQILNEYDDFNEYFF